MPYGFRKNFAACDAATALFFWFPDALRHPLSALTFAAALYVPVRQSRDQRTGRAPGSIRLAASTATLIKTLLRANAEFLAHAFSRSGALFAWRGRLSAPAVGACLVSMLIYSVNLVARTGDGAGRRRTVKPAHPYDSGVTPKAVMLRARRLAQDPAQRENRPLYTWLLKDLGASAAQVRRRRGAGFRLPVPFLHRPV